jgi:DNA (cytosine-5)-methyltransferase 1
VLTVGSLFAGIGGFDLGLERAGMRTLWQVELDAYCRGVLARHFPHAQRFEDVRSVGAQVAARVDVLAGGFPCQPVSQNGRKLAQADERWLWPEFARIVRELRPRYVLVENVAGLLDRGMGDVLGDLAAVGYDAEWDSVPAAVVGAPHIRERVWLVAYPAGPRLQGRVAARRVWDGELPPVSDWWRTEPDVARMASGVPGGVDDRIARTQALGNALVPAIAEWIGRRIVEYEAQEGRLAA